MVSNLCLSITANLLRAQRTSFPPLYGPYASNIEWSSLGTSLHRPKLFLNSGGLPAKGNAAFWGEVFPLATDSAYPALSSESLRLWSASDVIRGKLVRKIFSKPKLMNFKVRLFRVRLCHPNVRFSREKCRHFK